LKLSVFTMPTFGWFGNIFMEPAKTHGIYSVLMRSAPETVVFAAF